jgi:uncharacterized protein
LERFAENRWEGYHLAAAMLERGYLFRSAEDEEARIQERYLEFMDEYERTPVQLIFAPTYSCNFRCAYCFQEEYGQGSKIVTPEITDAFFAHVNKKFASESVRPYITLFGGEPLLPGNHYRTNLIYFLEQAKRYGYGVAIVTNGYELESYIPEFQRIGSDIREIQVTLDGDQAAHDARRYIRAGEPTFERIASGIDLALRSGYRINLRSIMDRDNIESLTGLAHEAERRGWLDYAPALFESTLGRNYDLHTCRKTESLYSRTEMWSDFVRLAAEHPLLRRYHRPQFHGMRYLSDTGELPFPVFDGCPAGKKEWAFDLNGDIYGCTASVGVKSYRLGSYTNPDESPDEKSIMEWKTRDVLSIDECRECAYSLSCGGGCGVLACNASGKIHSPDCRPVADLVAMGLDYYRIGEES